MGTTGTTTVDVSARHRDVWNQVAEELGYGIRWAVDMGEVHEIDFGSAGQGEFHVGLSG